MVRTSLPLDPSGTLKTRSQTGPMWAVCFVLFYAIATVTAWSPQDFHSYHRIFHSSCSHLKEDNTSYLFCWITQFSGRKYIIKWSWDDTEIIADILWIFEDNCTGTVQNLTIFQLPLHAPTTDFEMTLRLSQVRARALYWIRGCREKSHANMAIALNQMICNHNSEPCCLLVICIIVWQDTAGKNTVLSPQICEEGLKMVQLIWVYGVYGSLVTGHCIVSVLCHLREVAESKHSILWYFLYWPLST